EVRSLPVPASGTGRDRFFQQWQGTRPHGLGWRRTLLGLAAAVILALGLAWLLVPKENPQEAPALRDQVVARSLKHYLNLAETLAADKQLQDLGELAGDLRVESFRQAKQNAVDSLRFLTHLYARVVQEGVVEKALGIPASQRRELVPA